MREPYYAITCNLIQVSPVYLMGVTWLSIYYLAPYHKKTDFCNFRFKILFRGFLYVVLLVLCSQVCAKKQNRRVNRKQRWNSN